MQHWPRYSNSILECEVLGVVKGVCNRHCWYQRKPAHSTKHVRDTPSVKPNNEWLPRHALKLKRYDRAAILHVYVMCCLSLTLPWETFLVHHCSVLLKTYGLAVFDYPPGMGDNHGIWLASQFLIHLIYWASLPLTPSCYLKSDFICITPLTSTEWRTPFQNKCGL